MKYATKKLANPVPCIPSCGQMPQLFQLQYNYTITLEILDAQKDFLNLHE